MCIKNSPQGREVIYFQEHCESSTKDYSPEFVPSWMFSNSTPDCPEDQLKDAYHHTNLHVQTWTINTILLERPTLIWLERAPCDARQIQHTDNWDVSQKRVGEKTWARVPKDQFLPHAWMSMSISMRNGLSSILVDKYHITEFKKLQQKCSLQVMLLLESISSLIRFDNWKEEKKRKCPQCANAYHNQKCRGSSTGYE